MIDAPDCPACGQAHRRLYFATAGARLYECLECGLVYLDPLPGSEELDALYTDAYAGAQTGYFAKPEKKLRRSRIRARIIARLFKRSNGRFLDIGCNGGFMVEAARALGFDAWGIDPDPVSVRYAQQHFPDNHFICSSLEDFLPVDTHGMPARFDVIYCSEVIEHVPTPDKFLSEIFHLLAPGGLAYLTTPDISHWRRPRDLMRWDAFCPPSHCIYFTPASLIKLAKACGFTVHSKRRAWKPGIKLVLLRPVKS